MTREQILKAEEDIAKFCGWRLEETEKFSDAEEIRRWILIKDYDRITAYTYSFDITNRPYTHELAYSSDIDWLYGAWEKFRDLKFEGKIFLLHNEKKQIIKDAIMDKGVYAGFLEMIKAIEWYNSFDI